MPRSGGHLAADGAQEGKRFVHSPPAPHPRLPTARPESCYGDSWESSEDPLTAPAMSPPHPFPVRNR